MQIAPSGRRVTVLRYTSELYSHILHAPNFGINLSNPSLDWANALKHKQKVVDKGAAGIDYQGGNKEVRALQALLTEKKVTIALSEKTREWLGEKGYDPEFGARPLGRMVDQQLEKGHGARSAAVRSVCFTQRMNEAIDAYFGGGKSGRLVLAGVGLTMIITAVVLFPPRYELRAFAITVGVYSLLQLVVGLGLFLKSDGQMATLESTLAVDRAAMLVTELPRMEKVQANFVALELAWLVMIIAGSLVAWRLKENVTVSGIALGMMINAAVLLAFDVVAERRGAAYLTALKSGAEST